MVELNIDRNHTYIPEDIGSGIKSKRLLDYHYESYSEYKKHIEKIVEEIIAKASDLKKIKEEIISKDRFLLQLEEIEQERQSLHKKCNQYFNSKKFTNPDQETLAEDPIIRQELNKDENYNYIGSITNIVFDVSCIKCNPRYAEAILRQKGDSVNYIKLNESQVETLKEIAYSSINPDYEAMLSDLDSVEEELVLNKQFFEGHLSELLGGLL